MFKGRNVKVKTEFFLRLDSIEYFLNQADINVLEIANISKEVEGYRVTFVYEDVAKGIVDDVEFLQETFEQYDEALKRLSDR